jgi:hypothetical protein
MEAPLWRRLEAYVETQRAFSSPFVDATQSLVERLRAGDVGHGAPGVDDAMPPFLSRTSAVPWSTFRP